MIMEGTIYYTCQCCWIVNAWLSYIQIVGTAHFYQTNKKKKELTFNTSLLQKDLQYKNCKAQQCGCPPPPPQEKVVQKKKDLTKVEMVMTKKDSLAFKIKSLAKVCAFEYPALSKK